MLIQSQTMSRQNCDDYLEKWEILDFNSIQDFQSLHYVMVMHRMHLAILITVKVGTIKVGTIKVGTIKVGMIVRQCAMTLTTFTIKWMDLS